MLFISFFTRLRKRFIVTKSGRSCAATIYNEYRAEPDARSCDMRDIVHVGIMNDFKKTF